MDPKLLRKEILKKRDALAAGEIRYRSDAIARALRGLVDYALCKMPMFYASFRSEVYTHGLIRERLAARLPVSLPVTDVEARELRPRLVTSWEGDLRTGAYGILEPDPACTRPLDPRDIDLVVVPGSVFDKGCGRYGYGGGYYDRFLSQRAPQALRVALAFDFQVMDAIPLREHDERMDVIVTEDGPLMCRARA